MRLLYLGCFFFALLVYKPNTALVKHEGDKKQPISAVDWSCNKAKPTELRRGKSLEHSQASSV